MPKPKDFAYGVLNPIESPTIQERIDLSIPVSDIFRKVAIEAFTPNAFKNTGPYKAIVLRVEPSKEPEPGSWVSRIWDQLFDKSEEVPPIIAVKARIPEIHAALPIPDELGNSLEDIHIIDMYPTFIAQKKDLPIPKEGSLIWVDFGNKTNLTDPIYIKPVNSIQTKLIGKKPSAQTEHKSACGGKFLSKAPTGDILVGKNKALSHSGLPLNSRKTMKSLDRENKLIKGNRSSDEITTKWQKAIKSKGVPGVSWVGVLNSNGADDKYHEQGKRENIIFAPYTTDFSSPIELMYFFHGLGDFDNDRDFSSRLAPAIKKLSEANRNFVLVVPELPWTKRSIRPARQRQGTAWKGFDDFSNFHREILATIKENFNLDTNIEFISITAYGAGGEAIATAVNSLSSVNPNKITFAEADWDNWVEPVLENYINGTSVELNILTRQNGLPSRNADKIQKKVSENISTIYFQKFTGKNANTIGDESLLFVNPNIKREIEKKIKEAVEIEKINPPKDFDSEEGPGANFENEDTREAPKQPESRLPPGKNARVSSSTIGKKQTSKNKRPPEIKQAEPFTEARVRISDYGSLNPGSDVLVDIPPEFRIGGEKKIHKLVLERLGYMNTAWLEENPNAEPIKIISGWRRHRWDSFEQYEAFVRQKYGSVEEGRKWLAYASPHETGLAIDIGNNGLYPSRKTNDAQKKTKLYNWLKENAHRYGFTPYKREAWHWEVRLPRESWVSAEEFTTTLGVRVEDPGTGGTIPSKSEVRAKSCVSNIQAIASTSTQTGREIQKQKTLDEEKESMEGNLTPIQRKKIITELSQKLGIEPEVAYAFFVVESGGREGINPETGLPLIRFEPHVFANPVRMATHGVNSADVPWSAPTSLERKRKWKELGFSHGSNFKTNHREYKAFEAAKKINEELAYESISVGAAQIMGFNHKSQGFKTAKEMFEAYAASEEEQIKGFFTYVKRRAGGKMLSALKKNDFVTAALLYNGRGKQQLYGQKISRNYLKFKKQGLLA